jgi:hypothetical protein
MASAGRKARQAAYRHSAEGKLARKMYLQQPEVKARMAVRRQMKQKQKRGY